MTISTYDFDLLVNRRGTDCVKYDFFEPDVLPMWVADMDFVSPAPVIQALQERVAHGVFGYQMGSPALAEVICQRMAALYDWEVQPEELVFLPGVVAGFNVAMRAYGTAGDKVLMQTPVYPPFLSAPAHHGQAFSAAVLAHTQQGGRLRYEIDFDAFEAAIDGQTRLFLLCSPHNPVGRVWTKAELGRLVEICEKHDLVICSDEIHCDLLFDDAQHIPTATLSPAAAQRTITLMAPSKTFNLPGLACAFAIIPNPTLRAQFQQAAAGIVGHVNNLGFTAALAAYQAGGDWLSEALAYMQANRDYTTQFVEEHLPDVAITHPEGTYLSWLDTRAYFQPGTGDDLISMWIDQFFLKEARVALNAGGVFGAPGEGYVRFNFATRREVIMEALHRMKTAIDSVRGAAS